MKIEVKTKGSKEYYDEFLYMAFKYKRIKKNPKMKARKLTSFLICHDSFILLSIILFIIFYWQYNDLVFIFFCGMMTLLFIYILIYLKAVKKQIKNYMGRSGNKTIDINDKCIEYKDEEKDLRIKWEDIHSIIINKYSICFLPIEQSSKIFIALSIEYKNEVLSGIEKYKKKSLLIDNSDFYE